MLLAQSLEKAFHERGLLAFAALFVVQPESFKLIPLLDVTYLVAQAFLCLWATALVIGRLKITGAVLVTILYQGLFVVITYVYEGDIVLVLKNFVSVLVVVSLLVAGLLVEPNLLLKSFSTIAFIWLILNLITVLLFPDGLYLYHGTFGNPCYLLGHRNTAVKVLLPNLLFVAAKDQQTPGSSWTGTKVYVLLMALTFVLTWSLTALLGVLVVLIGLLAYRLNFRTPHPLLSVIITVIASVMLVVFRFQERFAYFLERYLDRTASLSGRTQLWEELWVFVNERIWLGHGIETSIEATAKMKVPVEIVSAHNYYFDTVYYGGAISFGLFCLLTLILGGNNRDGQERSYQGISRWVLLSLLVIGVTEPLGIGLKFLSVPIAFMLHDHVNNSLSRIGSGRRGNTV